MVSLPLSRRRLWGTAAALAIERVYGPLPVDPPPMLVHSRAVELVARPTGPAEPMVRAVVGMGTAIAAGRFVRSTTLGTLLSSTYPSLRAGAAATRDALARGDVPTARHRLSAITAWDVDEATVTEIAALGIEALAEGVADAAFAPALAAIAGGAPAALGYRAAAGLRGSGPPEADLSGRVADAVLAVSERAALAALVVARPSAREAVTTALAETAGVKLEPGDRLIAGYAGALGVRLGGAHLNAGTEVMMPAFGARAKPTPGNLGEAIALTDRIVGALLVASVAVGWAAGRS